MSLPREVIYGILFQYAQAALGGPFKTISRETVEVQRIPPSQQPVLFLDEALEDFITGGVGLTSHKATIYFHVGCTSQKGTPAATILNPLLDALEAAFANGAADEAINALLVQQGYSSDDIERVQFAGLAVKDLGQNSTDPEYRQAVAYVPFEIIYP